MVWDNVGLICDGIILFDFINKLKVYFFWIGELILWFKCVWLLKNLKSLNIDVIMVIRFIYLFNIVFF